MVPCAHGYPCREGYRMAARHHLEAWSFLLSGGKDYGRMGEVQRRPTLPKTQLDS
jgi:hypothetical protein